MKWTDKCIIDKILESFILGHKYKFWFETLVVDTSRGNQLVFSDSESQDFSWQEHDRRQLEKGNNNIC